MKTKKLLNLKSKGIIAILFLLTCYSSQAQYFWQVSSVTSLTGPSSTNPSTSVTFTLAMGQCAGGIMQPHNSTSYTRSVYINTLNSTSGGTLVASTGLFTQHIFNPTETFNVTVPSTAGTYYYYVVLSNPSMTTCGFTSTLTSATSPIIVNCPSISSSISSSNITCFGFNDGSATVSASGGGTPYTYAWSSGSTNSTASNLGAGTYTCTVSNNCGSTSTSTVSISEPSQVIVQITGNNSICAGQSTTLTASGAVTYSWNTSSTSASIITSPTVSTTYTVTGTDNNGCSNTAISSVSVNSLPSVSVSGTSTLCVGTSSVLTASGALTYLWNTGANTTSISVSPSTNTTYTVTGTDANGCSNDATKTITTVNCMGVSSVSCGLTIYNMNVSSSAVNVPGAVQYRFNFYNNSTNALIASKTQASRTFTFNSVSGLYYGNTYKWTVAVDKGAGFGSESSLGCTVVFGAPITNVPCGNSFTNLNITQAAQAVHNATSYRFTFYDNSTNALVATKTQASNTINFSTVSGLNYGQTYRWRVEVQYNNGSTLLYGPISTTSLCTITFNAPQTTLPCGNTYPATSASIGFPSVAVANSYRVTFYDAATSALVAAKVFGTNYVYFNQVPGLVYNKTYKWTVEVNYNNGTSNVYGAPSSTNCLVTWGSAGSIVMNGADNTNARLLSDKSKDEIELSAINLYPNPNNGLFNIELSSVSQVIVTNALGQIVLNKTIDAGKNSLDIQNQSNGLYFVKVIQNNKQQTLKLIKE